MKIVLIVLVFNNITGDVEKYAVPGVSQTNTECMIMAGEYLDKYKSQIKPGQTPFPICLDTEPMFDGIKI